MGNIGCDVSRVCDGRERGRVEWTFVASREAMDKELNVDPHSVFRSPDF